MKRRARARASPKIAKRVIIIGSCETRLLNPGENGYCARYLLIRASLKSQLVSSRIRDNCVPTAERDNLCVLSIEFDRGYLSFLFISFIFIIFYFFSFFVSVAFNKARFFNRSLLCIHGFLSRYTRAQSSVVLPDEDNENTAWATLKRKWKMTCKSDQERRRAFASHTYTEYNWHRSPTCSMKVIRNALRTKRLD